MVYRADDEAVREKRQAYEEALYQHRIKLYQDEIDAVQKQIDLLNEKIEEYNETLEQIDEEIERLEEIKEGYEEEIEKLQEKNEKLQENIDKIDEYYQKLIDGVNEYKKQWEELLEIEKEAQDLANLESLGINPYDVINLNPEAFEAMKENYLAVLAAVYQENELMMAKLGEVAGVEMDNYLTKTQELIDKIEGINLTNIKDAINDTRDGVDSVLDCVNETVTGFEGLEKAGIKSFTEITTTANNAMSEAANKVDEQIGGALRNLPSTASEAGSQIASGIQSALNDTDFNITVKANVIGEVPKGANAPKGGTTKFEGTVGNAFATGTGYPGLDKAETALRSEYGQPELTVYPNGHYELTTQPTLSDLPKDTVIFNEEQTKRILNNSKQGKGKAFASGTTPLANVMPNTAALFENFEAQLINNVSAINSNIFDMKKDINDIASTLVSNVSNINSGGNVTVNGGVNITCPGVTSKEVTEDIAKQLNDVFFGMSTNAYQRAMTRK